MTPQTKIVICDVDGTITTTDVMGHVSFYLRFDSTREGLCKLLHKIDVRSGGQKE